MRAIISKGGFKPFTLKIEVESIDELQSLWHRFNASIDRIKTDASRDWGEPIVTSCEEVFGCLDETAEVIGYKGG